MHGCSQTFTAFCHRPYFSNSYHSSMQDLLTHLPHLDWWYTAHKSFDLHQFNGCFGLRQRTLRSSSGVVELRGIWLFATIVFETLPHFDDSSTSRLSCFAFCSFDGALAISLGSFGGRTRLFVSIELGWRRSRELCCQQCGLSGLGIVSFVERVVRFCAGMVFHLVCGPWKSQSWYTYQHLPMF